MRTPPSLPSSLPLLLAWLLAAIPARGQVQIQFQGQAPANLPGRGPALPPPPKPFPSAFRVERDSPWQRQVEGRLVPKSAGVFHGTWVGWTNSLLLQATSAPVDVVIAPEAGGRVLRFSLNGENALWDPAAGGGTLTNPAGMSMPAGGYQCDLGPEQPRMPERRQLWSGRHAWSSPGDWRVQVRSGRDSSTGLEIQKLVRLDPETGGLHLTQWLVNRTGTELQHCLRDRTLCPSGGFVLFPLRAKSRYSAGWALRRPAGEGFAYDGKTPFSPRVRVLDGMLIAQPGGETTHLGADTDGGWVAYAQGRILLVKFFGHDPDARQADPGNTLEVAWDGQSVELQPISPLFTLRRHRPQAWNGRWFLLPLDQPVTTFDQARALAGRIASLKGTAMRREMAGLKEGLPWLAAAKTALPQGTPLP